MAILIQKPLTFASCKKLADIRFAEAKLLYKHRKYSGAYYLAGYSIEIGLKALFCKSVKKFTFPDKQVVSNLYVHDLNSLLGACGLKQEFEKDSQSNISLQQNWETVKDWSEKSRYSQNKRSDSYGMLYSVEVILNWLKTKW